MPIIHNLLENKDTVLVEGSCCQPNVIIVSPTRELAIQIFEQAKKFAYGSIIKTVVTYGGTSVAHQKGQVAVCVNVKLKILIDIIQLNS